MSEGTVNLKPGQAPQSARDHVVTSRTHALLDDNTLSDAEKRDILASWASDKRAVADQPSLRALDDGTIVFVDDIMDALRSLDQGTIRVMPSGPLTRLKSPTRRRPSASARWVRMLQRRRRDDDDDPPPCPAGSARPFGPYPRCGNAGVLAEVC
jgi:hypothetical protein